MRTRILDLPVQTATHAHPEHQLVIGLRGCADFEVQGQGGAVNRLHACVVPGGEAHAFSGRGHNHMLIMDLPSAAAGALGGNDAERLFERPRFVQLDHQLQGLLDFAQYAVATPQAEQDGLNWHLGGVLLAALQRRLGVDAGAQRARGALSSEELQRLETYVLANLDRPLSVASLAAQVCVSSSHFHALYRQATGMTPHQHVLALRVREAAHLLRDSALPVAEVASRCGFSSQSALTHALRRQLGQTPRALRIGG
ncbi:helix-turn-helix domain-containing protein [Halopseudomonas pachastrellae]|uniref:helix-turn-helix domain-containing protein n=1 Tax=Halopseudomonas pachastrellae TaxID=254161 RepID=UPI003D7D083C